MNNKAFFLNNHKEFDHLQNSRCFISFHFNMYRPEFEFIEFSYKFIQFRKPDDVASNEEGEYSFKSLLEFFD